MAVGDLGAALVEDSAPEGAGIGAERLESEAELSRDICGEVEVATGHGEVLELSFPVWDKRIG